MARTYQEDMAIIQQGIKVVEDASTVANQLHAKKQSTEYKLADMVKEVETLFGTSDPEDLTRKVEAITRENNVAADAYIASANKYAADVAEIAAKLKEIGG